MKYPSLNTIWYQFSHLTQAIELWQPEDGIQLSSSEIRLEYAPYKTDALSAKANCVHFAVLLFWTHTYSVKVLR